jgi:hypothetical protein
MPNRKKRNDASCKIDAELVHKGKIVADFKGTTVAEFFSELIREAVEREYKRVIREASKKIEKEE